MSRILHIVPGTSDVANGMVVVARLLAKEQGDAVVVDLNHEIHKIHEKDVEEVWVHGMWLPKEWAACRMALRAGKRLVRMTHGSLSPVYLTRQSPFKKKLISPIERYFLRRADKVVATCEAEAEWIRAYLGNRCPPIEVTDIKRFFKLNGEVSTRNRPLRVGATPGEAAKPSEMRLSRSDQVWVSEANCEAAARPRASAERREDAELSLGRCPRPPSAEGSPISFSAHSAPLRLCAKNNEQDEPLHLLYLGRRHPLKGVEYLETAVAKITRSTSPIPHSPFPVPHSPLPVPRSPQLKVVSNAFGEEKEKVWEWCDILILPTLSDNFGLVIAEALERGKCVITTDGAPAWNHEIHETHEKGVWSGYGGRLIYLKGYRDGTPAHRVKLLKRALESLLTSNPY